VQAGRGVAVKRRISGFGTRRRVMALASVVGAVTTLLVATPTHASDVHETRAVSGATVWSVTAHAAAGGKISPLSNPLDITCDLTVGAPVLEPAGFISGDTIVACHFDATGRPAIVQSMLISDSLRFNGTLVAFDGPTEPNVDAWFASANGQCSIGNWANTGQTSITWPAGYTPAFSTSPPITKFFVPSYCPVPVPSVTGMTESQASGAITAAGLVPNPQRSAICIDPGHVYAQNPDGGAMKPPGSTVTIFVDTGTQKGCVIK